MRYKAKFEPTLVELYGIIKIVDENDNTVDSWEKVFTYMYDGKDFIEIKKTGN